MAATSRASSGSAGGSSESARRSFRRLLTAATALAGVGAGLSALILWVHGEIESGGGTYTSFCNVSSVINCDRVLASGFARIYGVPIAWLSLAGYAGLAFLFRSATWTSGSRRQAALVLSVAASIGAAAFSAYMAFVSFFVLRTICPMCIGLYVVSLGVLWVAALLPARYERAYAGIDAAALSRRTFTLASLASLLVVASVAAAAWSVPKGAPATRMTLAELRAADEEFYTWYLALPVLEPSKGAHGSGRADAPVTINEFSDFECGHCARNHELLHQLLARSGDDVRVVHRHFPLDAVCNEALEDSIHPGACRAAEAAECAGEQDGFQQMADALFANQGRLTEGFLFTLAERIGLDMSKFRGCMSEHRGRGAVIADAREGRRLGITSTPTLFINGRKVEGTLSDLAHYVYAVNVERELASERAANPRDIR